MQQITYEKPMIIRLNNKTTGQVSTQGWCHPGSWPGPNGNVCNTGDGPQNSYWCENGYSAQGVANSHCTTGTIAGGNCGTGSGIT